MRSDDVVVEGDFIENSPGERASALAGKRAPPRPAEASARPPEGFGTRVVAGPSRRSVVELVGEVADGVEDGARLASSAARRVGRADVGERMDVVASAARTVSGAARATKAAADEARRIAEEARPVVARIKDSFDKLVGRLRERGVVGRDEPRRNTRGVARVVRLRKRV
jgi:hypothetical protein